MSKAASIVALTALFAGAEAFVSPMVSGVKSVSKTTMMAEKSAAIPFMKKPENLSEDLPGYAGFDPMGFSDVMNVDWLREAEIKHGRVCMLAVVGFLATDAGIHLPGDMHDFDSLLAHDAAVKNGAMTQLLMWIGFAECFGALAVSQMLQGSGRAPGDFGFDPLNFSKDEASAKTLATKEIKNGRLAMLAFSGIVTQAALTGNDFPYMYMLLLVVFMGKISLCLVIESMPSFLGSSFKLIFPSIPEASADWARWRVNSLGSRSQLSKALSLAKSYSLIINH